MMKIAVLIWFASGVFLASSAAARAESKWEVLVAFLGSTETDPEYQRDIDRNVAELVALPADRNFKLTVYREFPSRQITWVRPQLTTTAKFAPTALFFAPELVSPASLPGKVTVKTVVPGTPSIFGDSGVLKPLLQKAFSKESRHRVLLMYGHGLGPAGLRGISTRNLRDSIQAAIPPRPATLKPLDLLFLDSCLMGSVEVAYEFRKLATYFIANQDAEFSSGLPYDTFATFSKAHDDLETPILDLAERFLESYTFTKNGSQREAVFSSAATISVTDTDRLEELANAIRAALTAHGRLKPLARTGLGKKLARYRMQDTGLVDLGRLAEHFRKDSGTPVEARAAWTRVALLLEMTGPDRWKLKSQPRILLDAPAAQSGIVFGYDGYTRGFQGDTDTVARIPETLRPTRWLHLPDEDRGPWPGKAIQQRIYVTPFFPGAKEFNYRWVRWPDGEVFGPIQNIVRDSETEYRMRLAEHAPSPIVLAGYTQGIGSTSERYTGLSVLDPATGNAGMSYVDLEWNQVTGWSEF
ncbi:MAG: clostripain-related cysteine peptidase [Bdellovibrionota bacterium]